LDDEASVTVPFSHQGAAARRVFEEIWSYLEIIEREGGFFTYDLQVERVLDLQKDFEASLSFHDGVSREISDHFSVQQKKPWWQFWN
jgi:hypothetical protein